MNCTIYAEDLLGRGDADVVKLFEEEVIEASAVAGEGGNGEAEAAGAAVEVENQAGLPLAEEGGAGDDDVVDVGVFFKERNELGLGDDTDAEVGPVGFEEMNPWSCQDTIAE
jgi:hypothetical protein